MVTGSVFGHQDINCAVAGRCIRRRYTASCRAVSNDGVRGGDGSDDTSEGHINQHNNRIEFRGGENIRGRGEEDGAGPARGIQKSMQQLN